MPESTPAAESQEAPLTLAGVQRLLPTLVMVGGLFVAGATAWFGVDNRLTLLEQGAKSQQAQIELAAKIEPRLALELGAIRSLLVEMICTQQPQDPERCRRATRIVAGSAGQGP